MFKISFILFLIFLPIAFKNKINTLFKTMGEMEDITNKMEDITNKIQKIKLNGNQKNQPTGVTKKRNVPGFKRRRSKSPKSPKRTKGDTSPDLLDLNKMNIHFGKKTVKVKQVGLTPEEYTIKLSTIPNAGNGAFANIPLPKGTVLGAYKGKKLSKSAYERLADDSYVWELSSRHGPVYMDGKNPKLSNWLRFLNDSRDRRINVEPYQYRQNIYYRTIKSIKPGQELFVSYGDHYW